MKKEDSFTSETKEFVKEENKIEKCLSNESGDIYPKEEKSLNINAKVNSIKNDKSKAKLKSKNNKGLWVLKIGILTLALSLFFSVVSEIMLNKASIIVAVILIVLLLFIGIFFDMIGMAFASCPIEPLLAMASKKVKGAKVSIKLVKNADKVCSICSDVIGDICGILSGAAGATIAIYVIGSLEGSVAIIIGALVSSLIAALTVTGKAYFKDVAIKKTVNIVSVVGRCLSVFSKNK